MASHNRGQSLYCLVHDDMFSAIGEISYINSINNYFANVAVQSYGIVSLQWKIETTEIQKKCQRSQIQLFQILQTTSPLHVFSLHVIF